MTSRNVTKVLAGIEDILTGVGTQVQTRNGQSVTITKVDIAFAVSSTAEMQDLDVTKYTRARVYASGSNVAHYYYDAANNTGISSNTGPGSWILSDESAKVLAVEDRDTLRLTTPAFNQQLTVALGATALGVGFGGIFWYDETDTTTADDGADVFVTGDGERWKRIPLEAEESSEYVSAGGTANALTATYGFSSIPTDKVFWIRAIATNTGSATLNIDGTGALQIYNWNGLAIPAGAIESGKTYGFVKFPSSYRLLYSSVSEASAIAGTDNYGFLTALRLAQVLASGTTPQDLAIADLEVATAALLEKADGEILDTQTFTANGTWTKPATAESTDTVVIRLVSGGASGAAFVHASDPGGAGGGGGGCVVIASCRVSDLGSTEPVVVGAGGSAVTQAGAGSSPGVNGGPSYFGTGTAIIAVQGVAGTTSGGGDGGKLGSNVLNTFSRPEFDGGNGGSAGGGAGSIVLFGAGGGGGATIGAASSGTVSSYCGNGGDGASGTTGTTTASAGAAPGGGGGGARASSASTTAISGAGARGEVVVKVIKGWHPEGLPFAFS